MEMGEWKKGSAPAMRQMAFWDLATRGCSVKGEFEWEFGFANHPVAHAGAEEPLPWQSERARVTYIHGVVFNLIDVGQPLRRKIIHAGGTAQPC